MTSRLATLRAFLRGDPGDASGRSIVLAVTGLGAVASALANIAGAAVVFVLLVWVLPAPDGIDRGSVIVRNLVVGSGYLVVSLLVGATFGLRRTVRALAWLRDEREPEDDERGAALGLAFEVTLRQARYWVLAVVLFTGLNAAVSTVLGVEVGLTVLMGGTVTAAGTYLLYQRVMRPAVARALESEPPGKFRVPGVTLRIFLIWALGTAVPVAGIALLAGGTLVIGEVTVRELAVAGLVLALVALAAGFTTIMILTRAVADPLRLMREAIRSMEAGDYDVVRAGVRRQRDRLPAGRHQPDGGRTARARVHARRVRAPRRHRRGPPGAGPGRGVAGRRGARGRRAVRRRDRLHRLHCRSTTRRRWSSPSTRSSASSSRWSTPTAGW